MSTNRTFNFSVSEYGDFSFNPPGDWGYFHHDSLQFQSPSGPFAISLKRKDYSPEAGPKVDPVGGQVHAEKDEATGQWIATVSSVEDGLTDAERSTIYKANVPPFGNPKKDGFIAKYRYSIGVVVGSDKVFLNDVHNGVYNC